jgi:predicted secreted hydrolase
VLQPPAVDLAGARAEPFKVWLDDWRIEALPGSAATWRFHAGQNGIALDLNTSDPGVLRWLQRNAGRFDFLRTVPREDWHWEYRP